MRPAFPDAADSARPGLAAAVELRSNFGNRAFGGDGRELRDGGGRSGGFEAND